MGARHALKLVNGSQGNFRYTDANGNPIGLTIASEQPVYVQGNYNADNNDATNWGGYTHLSSAVVADAVTLLSNAFDDRYSYEYPVSGPGGTPRTAAETYFRVAIAAGKNKPFFVPGNWGSGNGDTGTDGGVHNFIRYLEDWGATNVTLSWIAGEHVLREIRERNLRQLVRVFAARTRLLIRYGLPESEPAAARNAETDQIWTTCRLIRTLRRVPTDYSKTQSPRSPAGFSFSSALFCLSNCDVPRNLACGP